MSLAARTFTPLGIFGLYVAGHVYCREHKWHVERGYIRKYESTLQPEFKFDQVGDLKAMLRELNQSQTASG